MPREAKIIAVPTGDRKDAKQKICDAAIRCFEQYGPQRTSMADIAEESGISRKTLYRIFDDRASLIEYILLRRMYIMADKVSEKLAHYTDYEEAIVEGSIYSVNVSKGDTLFNDILTRDTNHRVEMFLLGPPDEVRQDIAEIWSGVIALGRQNGQVRDDLSDERVLELLISTHVLLLMRDDYTDADRRQFMNEFLLPALRPAHA